MNKRSGSSLFLMEMLMVVMFFILCASTCILVFVKSNNLSRLAKDTNQSVLISESMAEFFKAGDMEQCMNEMNGREEVENSYVIYYDQNWKAVPEQTGCVYQASLKKSVVDEMEHAVVAVTRIRDNQVLYQLEVSSYAG